MKQFRVRAMERREGAWDTVDTKEFDSEKDAKSYFTDLANSHQCTINKDKWYAYTDSYSVEFIQYENNK